MFCQVTGRFEVPWSTGTIQSDDFKHSTVWHVLIRIGQELANMILSAPTVKLRLQTCRNFELVKRMSETGLDFSKPWEKQVLSEFSEQQ